MAKISKPGKMCIKSERLIAASLALGKAISGSSVPMADGACDIGISKSSVGGRKNRHPIQ